MKTLQTVTLMLCAASCFAQGTAVAPAAGLAGEVKASYAGIKTNITKMADRMPEADYGFKATPDIRSFGELMQHMADAQVLYCSMSTGEMKRPAPSKTFVKADVQASLKASFDACDAVFDKLTDASAIETVVARGRTVTRLSVLYGMIIHANEEYGYGSIYLRLKGLLPPTSDSTKK